MKSRAGWLIVAASAALVLTASSAFAQPMLQPTPKPIVTADNEVWYQAGVDPYVGDKLGRLSLSLQGLRQRDQYVLETCRAANIPVVVTMGGGYAPRIEDIVEAHCNTMRVACRLAANPDFAAAL